MRGLIPVSALLQSHHQPLPSIPIPLGLVIKSLIIHRYSNHYLPFPGPQCRLRGIQSGSRTAPHPPKSTRSNHLPDPWPRPSLPTRCHKKEDTKLCLHLGIPQSQTHVIMWTLTSLQTHKGSHSLPTPFPQAPEGGTDPKGEAGGGLGWCSLSVPGFLSSVAGPRAQGSLGSRPDAPGPHPLRGTFRGHCSAQTFLSLQRVGSSLHPAYGILLVQT